MIKRPVITVFVLFLFLFAAQSQITDSSKIRWYTVEEADSLMRIKPKKIFIDVYTDWCGWCKVMDQKTFSNPVIARYLNEKYYPVKFNAEGKKQVKFAGQTFSNRGRTHDLAFALLGEQIGYPSTVYLAEDFGLLYKRSGFLQPQELEPILKFLGDNVYLTTSWDDFLKTFKGNVISPASN